MNDRSDDAYTGTMRMKIGDLSGWDPEQLAVDFDFDNVLRFDGGFKPVERVVIVGASDNTDRDMLRAWLTDLMMAPTAGTVREIEVEGVAGLGDEVLRAVRSSGFFRTDRVTAEGIVVCPQFPRGCWCGGDLDAVSERLYEAYLDGGFQWTNAAESLTISMVDEIMDKAQFEIWFKVLLTKEMFHQVKKVTVECDGVVDEERTEEALVLLCSFGYCF